MIEMILASMAGFWLGLYLLVAFGSLIWASERDSFFLGLAVIAISWAIGEFFFGLPILASIISNPFMLIVYIALFIAAGSLYTAMWRLPNFIKDNAEGIQIDYAQWKDMKTREADITWRSKIRDSIPIEKEEKQSVDISYDTFLESNSYNYSVRKNKDRVASWVLLWPASIAWELMHKPFIWLWENVYFGLGKVFERINKDAARKILEDKSK